MEINDNHRVSAPVGSFNANPWGLFDMHGNVAEWTLSGYQPYPRGGEKNSESADAYTRKVVRGGSWYDLPKRARSAARRAYHPWQPVFDVGFRVVASAQTVFETE